MRVLGLHRARTTVSCFYENQILCPIEKAFELLLKEEGRLRQCGPDSGEDDVCLPNRVARICSSPLHFLKPFERRSEDFCGDGDYIFRREEDVPRSSFYWQ